MFGLFKPEQTRYVTRAQLEIELDEMYNEIKAVSERITERNLATASANAREAKLKANEPLTPEQLESMAAMAKQMGLDDSKIAMGKMMLSTPQGMKLLNTFIKGLM